MKHFGDLMYHTVNRVNSQYWFKQTFTFAATMQFSYRQLCKTVRMNYRRDTYDVHESEQVFLHVFLAVKLDHRIVDAQQHFDVVGPVQAVSACASCSCVVDALLHTAVQRLQVHQAAKICTYNDKTTLIIKRCTFFFLFRYT